MARAAAEADWGAPEVPTAASMVAGAAPIVVDWQIQSATGAAVTCAAIHAAEVVVNIDGASYPQACSSGLSSGGQDILLQENYAAYQVTVNLVDVNGNVLAVPQIMIAVTSCG